VNNVGHPEASDAGLAFIDWLSFTVMPPQGQELAWLVPQLRELFAIPGLTQRAAGLHGYTKSYDIDGNYGLVAYGGIQQRGTIYVSLNAQACTRVSDWEKVREWGISSNARITRTDLTYDDLDGKTVSIELALEWYHTGLFSMQGRNPVILRNGDWDTLIYGRTLNFGRREHGKRLRIYEKGKQLGRPASPWARAELELHNKSRVIPWDVLTRPSEYLAGAYPCLHFLNIRQERIRTIQKSIEISLEALIRSAKSSYGKLIDVLLHKHQGDTAAVVADLIRLGVPKRLASYADFLPPNPEKLP
jgi:DNA relaxase NicK